MNNNFRSRLKIGNISIDCTQSFTKSQKEHWKDYFGISVEDITDIEAIAIVKTHWLNVRSGAGTNYSIVKALPNGTKVTVYEQKNGWSRIGSRQWVSSQYLK